MPFPFNWMPWPLNFLALWAGYLMLLVTFYCALVHFIRVWRDYPEEEYLDEKWREKQ